MRTTLPARVLLTTLTLLKPSGGLAGKSRSKLNALKHGQCSLARRAERRQLNESIRQLFGGGDVLPDSRREREAWRNCLALELEDGIRQLLARGMSAIASV